MVRWVDKVKPFIMRLIEYYERDQPQIPIVHGDKHSKAGIDPISDVVYQEDPIYIRDAAGNIINPATIEKQNDIITAISSTQVRDVSDRDARLLGRTKVLDSAGTVINPATKESIEATQPRNITHWGGIALTGRDISLDLAELSKKYSNRFVTSGSVTVPAGSSIDWLNVSGVGMLLGDFLNTSSGVAASSVAFYNLLDGVEDYVIRLPDIYYAYTFGYTAIGLYNLGNKSLHIYKWDTTNNVYQIYHVTEPFPVPFKSTLIERFTNTATANASMTEFSQYALLTASKVIYAKMVSQAEIHSPKAMKAKLLAASIQPIAITTQRLGYYTEEIMPKPPIMSEFPRDLPNESDDQIILPNGAIVKSRKHSTAHQIIEIHVDEKVSTDDVLRVIKPAKFLKEEIV